MKHLLQNFWQDIRAHKTRAFLTTMAITWGVLAVTLLMAFGLGLSVQMRTSFINAGDRIVRIYGGQTTKKWQGLPIGRQIRLVESDAEVLKKNIPQVAVAIPGVGKYCRLEYEGKTVSTYMEGVYPEFSELRRMFPAAGGRFINSEDLEQRRRVVFLGEEIAGEIFGKTNPIGQTLKIDGLPYKVIGIMPKKMQTSMNNGPDNRRAIIPFSTFMSVYGYRTIHELLVRPVDPIYGAYVEKEARRVLGSKYQFDPEDERALPVWNFIEEEAIGAKVFLGINIFLAIIGTMSLLVAGVGVANIMFVVVKERTREIGIKRAIGAKRKHILWQIVFESLLIAFSGGAIGLLISLGIVRLMWMIPAGDGAMQFLGRPILSGGVVFIAFLLLTIIGLLAGLFPARKAAAVNPVEALRYE
ncbi:MAG: ABC transporter permease [Calditrichia bacterium]